MSDDTPFLPTRPDTDADRPSARQLELPPVTYELAEVIGRGGMGEVVVARDPRIGREVALKRIGTGDPDDQLVQRFLREARIQARLDHPAIVPVYELGVDGHGRPFFTMKRLAGITLANKLETPGPVQPLLRALVDVCHAIAFAHDRGIVHRDLKPANIMLGNHGEVYVLDWGVARLLAEDGITGPPGALTNIDTLEGTQTGALLGTPGYIAPEVVNGKRAKPASDVYALGSILFEILAGEPLHVRGAPALVSTISVPQDSPAQRRPDRAVAPELDRLCFAALSEQPAQRPTARALADAIQAYLDGDRDVEQRRALAASVLTSARTALADGDRAAAIQRAGRALALDPESTEAAELVTSLIVEPPRELPNELVASLAADDRAATAARTRRGVYAYLAILAFWPITPFVDVADWRWVIALNVCLVGLVVFGARAARRARLSIPIAMAANLVLAALMTRIASPFLLTPLMICGALLAFSADRWTMARPRWLVGWGVVAVMLPFVLEALRLFPPSWRVDGAGFHAWSPIYANPNQVAAGALLLANLIFVCVVGWYALAINRSADAAKRQLHIQAWHLHKLLPSRFRNS